MTFFDFLSLKNDVNIPSKSNKQKIFLEQISLLLAFLQYLKYLDAIGRPAVHVQPSFPLYRVVDPE